MPSLIKTLIKERTPSTSSGVEMMVSLLRIEWHTAAATERRVT